MKAITITSADPKAAALVRKALENYALVHTTIAVTCRNRPTHPGETRAALEKRAALHDARAAAVAAMAEQINP